MMKVPADVATVAFHYISTAPSVVEQDAAFGGIAGMSAWSVARESADMAASLQKYLAPKLAKDSALRAFLEVADASATQTYLFRPVHWFLNQPGLDGWPAGSLAGTQSRHLALSPRMMKVPERSLRLSLSAEPLDPAPPRIPLK